MLEAKIEKHLVDGVKARGGLVRKLRWIGRRGAADRLVVWPAGMYTTLKLPPIPPDAPPEAAAEAAHLYACPPIVGPHPMAIHFIELKAPGKKPEDLQEREIARLRGMGCAVFVLDSIEAVDAYLRGRD